MRVVSLFSGAGGLDLGLVQAGHEIVWANDNDPDAVDTYAKNIGPHITCVDIAKVETKDVPKPDVVVGGFPCQGFSQANRFRSKEDDRNLLYTQFKRFVRELQPKYFLAENVRGILSLDKGEAIKTIHKELEECGYRVQVRLFNAADYGVPQQRWRVIIAGTRKDLPSSLDFEYPEPSHSKQGQALGTTPWVTVGEVLEDIPEPSANGHNLPNHVHSNYKVVIRDFTGHRATDPSKPSPTILARGNGKGGVCALAHPGKHRRMTIRESATMQSFPLDFAFEGRLNSCYRQVGNAVPVLFAKCLGEQLRKLERVLV